MILDPQEKENFKEVVAKFDEVYIGLVQKLSGKETCEREHVERKCNYPPPGVLDKEEREADLEALRESAAKRILLDEEVCDESREKRERRSSRKHKELKYPSKTGSKYDWSYAKRYIADDISSPSEMSLRSVKSYYSLPRDLQTIQLDSLELEDSFIQYPKKHSRKGKYLPPDEDALIKQDEEKQVAELREKCEQSKKQSRRMTQETREDFPQDLECESIKRSFRKAPSLFKKLEEGYVPELDDRADLISLYKKIKPKTDKGAAFLSKVKACEDYHKPEASGLETIDLPNNLRQRRVIYDYTPKDHDDLTVYERNYESMQQMAALNKMYYGGGPTNWKCDRLDNTCVTQDNINEMLKNLSTKSLFIADQQKCRTKRGIQELERNSAFPTVLSLTLNDITVIQKSWETRGIHKVILAMIWFTKVYQEDPDRPCWDMPDLTAEDLFFNEKNYNYIEKLANIFDLIIKTLHDPERCTALIWGVGQAHVRLNLDCEFFELLKEKLYETLKECMHPPPSARQLFVWDKFIEIMFNLLYECQLWNKFPVKRGFKKKPCRDFSYPTATPYCEDISVMEESMSFELGDEEQSEIISVEESKWWYVEQIEESENKYLDELGEEQMGEMSEREYRSIRVKEKEYSEEIKGEVGYFDVEDIDETREVAELKEEEYFDEAGEKAEIREEIIYDEELEDQNDEELEDQDVEETEDQDDEETEVQ